MTIPPPAEAEVSAVTGRNLRLRGVRHVFGSGGTAVVALEHVDIDIDAGELVAVVGPSGCGKTTLLHAIAGFLTPTEGTIQVGGDTVDRPGRDRGVVFQHATSLYPWLTVRQNVELGLRIHGIGRAARRRRALAELDRVGLGEFADRAVYELSGGMQQRCQIARVLANDPDVMLMDEPLGALDALTREQLQRQIRDLWQNTGRTVLLVTHSVEEAVLLGSRVLVMSPRPGRISDDLRLPYAGSDTPIDELRRDRGALDVMQHLREAIARGVAEAMQ